MKKASADARPIPRREAKDAAIAAAFQAFDGINSSARQASGLGARLRIAALAASEILTGKKPMRPTHALAGGASLLVLTLALMSAANLVRLANSAGSMARQQP